MTGSEQEQNTLDEKSDSLWDNGVFLFFFSASMTLMLIGLMFDGYVYYTGMQSLQSKQPYVSTDYSKVEEKKSATWESGEVKKANMVKSGTLVAENKLEVTVNDISFCKDRIANPKKVYSQVLYLKYTYKNTNSDEPISVSLNDLDVKDKCSTPVEFYPITEEPVYKKVNKGEEYTVTVPVATLHASADLFIGLSMKSNNLKCNKTLLIRMG